MFFIIVGGSIGAIRGGMLGGASAPPIVPVQKHQKLKNNV